MDIIYITVALEEGKKFLVAHSTSNFQNTGFHNLPLGIKLLGNQV